MSQFSHERQRRELMQADGIWLRGLMEKRWRDKWCRDPLYTVAWRLIKPGHLRPRHRLHRDNQVFDLD